MSTVKWIPVREEPEGQKRKVVTLGDRIKTILRKALKESLCPYCGEILDVGESSEGKTFGMGCSNCGMKVYLLVMTIEEGRRPGARGGKEK